MGRPRTPRTRLTQEYRSARRKTTVLMVAVVLAAVGWIAAIALVGGGNEQGSASGNRGEHPRPATTPATGAGGGSDGGTTADGKTPEHSGDAEQAQSDHAQADNSQSGKAGQGDGPSAGQGSDDGGGKSESVKQSDNESTTLPPEQAKEINERISHSSNPLLAKDPTASALSDTDRQRMRLASAKFITAAYGYSGDSEDDYRQGIADTALLTDLYRSPGGKCIDEDYAPAIAENGSHTAAKLQKFEVESIKDGQAEVKVRFTVSSGGSYNRYGELEGSERKDYTQELSLGPYGEVYRVTYASVEEAV